MNDQSQPRQTPSVPPGLCGGCRHARRIETRGGSVFCLCLRATDDPAFRRYPALPTLSCRGFERVDEAG
ncbi:MAG TPA: hypothetical protein VFW02_07575 [Candidatus Limnocylindrales bacterium]|nr:hypothetical protein [Candidatus Limnocylindrales bacterium]